MRINKKNLKRMFVKSLKIGLGSGIAIAFAHFLGLKYEVFAGTIALLTILTTRKETLKLSLYRILTFFVTIFVCFLVHNHLGGGWIEYGVFLLLIVFFCEIMGFQGTISVNAVLGVHLFTESDFSLDFIVNEFILLLIGILIAVVLSFMNNNRSNKKEILSDMKYVEDNLQVILGRLSSYLRNEPLDHSVWSDVIGLEDKIKDFIQEACEYNDNSFSSNPQYYVDYFEMRLLQVDVLHSLHYEMKRMRVMPVQAEIVADFMDFMTECIGKMNALDLQMERLEEVLSRMKQEKLPESRDEFENRAVLYHVLMEMEDFLHIKKRFVDGLSEKQRNETFIR